VKRTQSEESGERVANGSEANKPTEPRFFSVGTVARAHGVRGEVWVHVPRRTALPPLDEVTHMFVGPDRIGWALRSFRFHRGGMLLVLEGCADRTAAEALRGQEVSIPMQAQDPLDADEYFVEDLLGLRVRSEKGEQLGELVEVLPTGANDVYRVVDGQEELLLPAISTVIRAVDMDNGEMVVRLLPGLRC
jgi:16S rRNA processing protein RimM|tara:strand:- start:952 stop:1524 length:573 start_codon:yes stop_codon:yes gene_type:complete